MPADVTKTNTTRRADLRLPNLRARSATSTTARSTTSAAPARLHTSKTLFDVSKLDKLPQVGIVLQLRQRHGPSLAEALVDAKFDGIVSAGVQRQPYHTCSTPRPEASKRRHPRGAFRPACRPVPPPWMPRSMTPSTGFVAAETLNPQKAPVLLLMLALTSRARIRLQIQRWFQQF